MLLYTIAFDSDLLHFSLIPASQTLMWLFLSIITVILVYMTIRVWFNMWGDKNDFVSSKIKWLQDLVWKALSTTPIIPVLSYDKQWVPNTHRLSTWSIFDIEIGDSNIFNRWYQKKDRDIKWTVSNQVTEIENLFGVSTSTLTVSEINELEKVWNNSTIRWEKILDKQRNIINRFNKPWFTLYKSALNGNVRINQFTKWLNKVDEREVDDEWKRVIITWRSESDVNKRDLTKLFNSNSAFAKKFASYLWYDDWSFDNFESIKDLDVYRW